VRRIVAYSPAIALLAAGIIAVGVIPPVLHPIRCQCPVESHGNETPCLCPTGYTEDTLGVLALLIAIFAALVYSIAVHALRHRGAVPSRP